MDCGGNIPYILTSDNLPTDVPTFSRGDGWLADRFLKTSVVMPTYLVAFVVCDYKSINSSTTGGLEPKFVRKYWTAITSVRFTSKAKKGKSN